VLLLRGTVAGIPPALAGIEAGIRAPEGLVVHHLAADVSPLQNTPTGPAISRPSSVSGLIYYVDPVVDPLNASAPIPSDATGPYDFLLLSLKVLFANSAVQAFSSYAEMSIHQLFDTPVLTMGAGGNAYDAIVLSGSYYVVDGLPVYSLGSTTRAPFTLNNSILSDVEIGGVQMSTVSADPRADTVIQFAMAGFLDFAIVPGGDNHLDLFGFGNQLDQHLPGTGLAFDSLNLMMSYPTSSPSKRSFVAATDAMTFDQSSSTLRPGSLPNAFALQLTGLISSMSPPAQVGFLPVSFPDLNVGPLGTKWYGLVFRLDLGTPGNLAGKAGLQSSLLLAWTAGAPTGSAPGGAQIGLQLPGTAQGAPLISLQKVLKLSIGPIQLFFDATHQAYVLVLNELALSFLGLLKIPPNGATAFYLFGDASGTASALGWYAIYNNEPKTGTPRLVGVTPA
jgi:hypothetical protein